jgi:hypothetical protein
LPCGSDCFLMRATAGGVSNVVDLYDSGTGRWSTAQLSVARFGTSATSVGTMAIFAGGRDSKLMLVVLFVVRGTFDCFCKMCYGNKGACVSGCRAGAIAFLCAPLQVLVIPMMWTFTTAEQDDGRGLGSVRGAGVFPRHLLERWPCSLGVNQPVSC